MLAVNIAGQSEPSTPSLWFDTIQAAPTSPPQEVTVWAVNETALRVRWMVSIVQRCNINTKVMANVQMQICIKACTFSGQNCKQHGQSNYKGMKQLRPFNIY